MRQRPVPAVFMRGGTSKAIMFHARDLPDDRAGWDAVFAAAMGTPDPYGRQLDGMGGGLSSLSKVCVLAPSMRDDADIDYTFAQVLITENRIDYRGNCGNMSSAVGPFAIDEGLVRPNGDEALVRIYNTNTRKIILSRFALEDGVSRYDGPLAIPGVGGTGAPIRLEFAYPGGATTGKLLPTGRTVDHLDMPGGGRIEASLVDAGNATVFVRAADLGLTGRELPEELEARPDVLRLLDGIRIQGSVLMGIAPDEEAAARIATVPFVGFVSPAPDAPTLTGSPIGRADLDLVARAISSGQPHRALPLTVSLCIAVAARIEGTVVHGVSSAKPGEPIRLGMPSGILTVAADVTHESSTWLARSGSFYRTARRLFDGRVWVPASAWAAAAG